MGGTGHRSPSDGAGSVAEQPLSRCAQGSRWAGRETGPPWAGQPSACAWTRVLGALGEAWSTPGFGVIVALRTSPLRGGVGTAAPCVWGLLASGFRCSARYEQALGPPLLGQIPALLSAGLGGGLFKKL